MGALQEFIQRELLRSGALAQNPNASQAYQQGYWQAMSTLKNFLNEKTTTT